MLPCKRGPIASRCTTRIGRISNMTPRRQNAQRPGISGWPPAGWRSNPWLTHPLSSARPGLCPVPSYSQDDLEQGGSIEDAPDLVPPAEPGYTPTDPGTEASCLERYQYNLGTCYAGALAEVNEERRILINGCYADHQGTSMPRWRLSKQPRPLWWRCSRGYISRRTRSS